MQMLTPINYNSPKMVSFHSMYRKAMWEIYYKNLQESSKLYIAGVSIKWFTIQWLLMKKI